MTPTTPHPAELDLLWAACESGEAASVAAQLAPHAELSPAGLMLRGLARHDSGDFAAAASDLGAILAADAQNPLARQNLALVRFRLGDRAGAAHLFESGPFLPQHAFLKRFAATFWPLRRTDPALLAAACEPVPAQLPHGELLEQWRSNPGSSPPRRQRSLAAKLNNAAESAYLEHHDLPTAAPLFAAVCDLLPGLDTAASSLSWCRLHAGRHADARALLTPHVEAALARYESTRAAGDLPHPQLVVQWCWMLHEAGEDDHALAILSSVHPEGPLDFCAHLLAGLIWLGKGDREKADANLTVAFQAYFLDSWDYWLAPFVQSVIRWLKAPSAA